MKKPIVVFLGVFILVSIFIVTSRRSPEKTKVVESPGQAPEQAEEPLEATGEAAPTTQEEPKPQPDASAMDQKLEDARALIEKKVAGLMQSYENRIRGNGSQLTCENFVCNIKLPVDPKDEALRAELLKQVGAILMDASKEYGPLIKTASTNNIPADIVTMDIEFHQDDADVDHKLQEKAAQQKEMRDFLSPEGLQQFKEEYPSATAMESTVQYILREYQKNGQLGSIKNIRAECQTGPRCLFHVIHNPDATPSAAETDIFQLAGLVGTSRDTLGHKFKPDGINNVLKNGETFFKVRQLP